MTTIPTAGAARSVNCALIALNVLVFVFFQGMAEKSSFTHAFSTIPQEIMTQKDIVTEGEAVTDFASGRRLRVPGLEPTPVPVYLTLLTAMFMHASLMHLLGNRLYLHIFGDNVENSLGHLRYAGFYLLCGVLASLAHVFTSAALEASLLIPSLGASGAISGVQGGCLLLLPKRRVRALFTRSVVELPALVVIGVWFLFQFIAGVGMLADASGGGAAYGAHTGGFLSGLALIKLFAAGLRPPLAPAQPHISPPPGSGFQTRCGRSPSLIPRWAIFRPRPPDPGDFRAIASLSRAPARHQTDGRP